MTSFVATLFSNSDSGRDGDESKHCLSISTLGFGEVIVLLSIMTFLVGVDSARGYIGYIGVEIIHSEDDIFSLL